MEEGRVKGFVGSAIDAKPRLQAQEGWRRERGFAQQLLELMPLPATVVDEQGRTEAVNQAWQAFTGRSAAQAIGQVAADALATDQAALHARHHRAALAQHAPLRYEAPCTLGDGSVHDVVATLVRVPARAGTGFAVMSTFHDLTDLRDAERASAEARQIADVASQAKREFMDGVCHELQGPLKAIVDQAQQGLVQAAEEPGALAPFNEILLVTQRVLTLVAGLQEVAAIESSVGSISLQRVDLRPLIRAVHEEIGLLAQSGEVTVETHLPARPLLARADSARFQQVLRKVLHNAVRFSKPGLRIAVDARFTDDQGVEVSVTDRGPGIAPANLERIFDAFVPQAATSSRSATGAGLGLAICRRIIEAHGGSISAENIEAGGARFRIRLPPRGGVDTRPAPLHA
jgi:PAS domain S-box-containing protein